MNILAEIKPDGYITFRIEVKKKEIDYTYVSCNSRPDLGS